jgi:hypothetical protein
MSDVAKNCSVQMDFTKMLIFGVRKETCKLTLEQFKYLTREGVTVEMRLHM